MMIGQYQITGNNHQHLSGRNRVELYKNLLQPHFLFNSLNNLYAISIHRSEQTPQAIAELSKLLEQIVSCSRMDLIPLSDEIRLIEDYLSLEKIWLGETSFRVDLQVKGDAAEFCIPPMTIYTLVENAFKHGVRRCGSGAWITVHLTVKEDRVLLKIRNSVGKDTTSAGEHSSSQTGLGIEAVRKMLEGSYRKRYLLDARCIDDVFAVDLIICRNAA
ncbi:MAG: histidine kinase [Bacteroidales bacterium]